MQGPDGCLRASTSGARFQGADCPDTRNWEYFETECAALDGAEEYSEDGEYHVVVVKILKIFGGEE